MKNLASHVFFFGVTLVILGLGALHPETGKAQSQDRLPVREYTNPEEVVTFDRSTTFDRAVEVINEFSQEYDGRIILDRTGTTSELGISVTGMHWRDALDLILRVKRLQLIEDEEMMEIVEPEEDSDEDGEEPAGAQIASGEDSPAHLGSNEVRINAVFFEGNRGALQEVGVDWSTLTRNVPDDIQNYTSSDGSGGGGGGGGGSGGSNSGQLPGAFDDQFVSVNARGAQSVSQSIFNSLVNFGELGNSGIEVQALFSAFEGDDIGEVLASPTVKVIEGQEGRIQVGEDFSIKQRDFSGNVTDEFVSVGTILEVTPQIIEENDTTFIHLDIAAERSSAQPDVVSTIVQTQEAETQALLTDGEATSIAGLYRTEESEVRRGLPILKDLPPWFFGLRYLFGFNSKDYAMRELVILIQAEIVESIPERLNQRQRDKFEILRDERNNIREEIERKDYFDQNKDYEEEDGLEDERIEELENDSADSTEKSREELVDELETVEEELDELRASGDDTTGTTAPEENFADEELTEDPERSEEPIQLETDEGTEGTDEDSSAAETADETQEAEKEDDEGDETADNEGDESENDKKSMEESSEGETYPYYIIGSSFSEIGNAENFRDKLMDEGFDPVIIQTERYYMVAYGGYESSEEARSELSDIRDENEDAWLYTE